MATKASLPLLPERAECSRASHHRADLGDPCGHPSDSWPRGSGYLPQQQDTNKTRNAPRVRAIPLRVAGFCGAEGDRTPDLVNAISLASRLCQSGRLPGDRDSDRPKDRKLDRAQDRHRKRLPERRSVQVRLGQRSDLFALEDRGLAEPALPAPEQDVGRSRSQPRRARHHDDVVGMFVPVVGGEHKRRSPPVQAHPVEAASSRGLHLSACVYAPVLTPRDRRCAAAARRWRTPSQSRPLPAALRGSGSGNRRSWPLPALEPRFRRPTHAATARGPGSSIGPRLGPHDRYGQRDREAAKR